MKNIQRIVSVVLSLLTVMTLLVVPATSVSAAETGKKEWKTFEELVEEKGYLNGIQQPWFVYNSSGNDIGKSIMLNYGSTNYSDEMFYEVFTNSKAMGFDIIQFWMTYQFGGILFDSEFQVVGMEPTYKKNLDRVFQIAEECGIYISLAVINHTESSYYVNGKYRYEEICRFMHNEKQTQLFVDNWLIPMLEITQKHENIIMANVFVEPEANGGRWDITTGASWKNLSRFMKTVNDTIHKVNPRIKTYPGATGDAQVTFKYYEDIDFDCYGYDQYWKTAGAEPQDTRELLLNKPFVYGEYGVSDEVNSLTHSDEFMTSFFGSYFDSVVQNGVKAGFYWYYGYPGNAQSVIDEKNRLRPFAWAIRAWSLDAGYAKTGYEGIDAPTFMYSTSEAIRWFGSRGASNITLQRSDNGKTGWKTVISFNPDDPAAVAKYEYGAMMYEWTDPNVKEGETYYYRAIAADEEGKTAPSEVISITADIVTCSEEDNLIKNGGFENGPIKLNDKGRITEGVDGWIICNQPVSKYDMTHYQNGEAAHSGKGSVYQITKLHQAVTLKPNTDYTLTFYYKFKEVEGYWNVLIGFLSGYPENSDADPSKNGKVNNLVGTIRPLDKNKHGDWVRHTVQFNSGDITDTRLMFYSWQGGANQNDDTNRIDWYVDDVYLFETVK